MVEKIAFAPVVQKNPSFRGNVMIEKSDTTKPEENRAALLWGSLAVLGGLGLLFRKPKVIEKVVEKEADKTIPTVKNTVQHTVKSKRIYRNDLNIAGKESGRMCKSDAKWQRKRERHLINKQMEREKFEHFTEKELQAYHDEFSYQIPSAEQSRTINELNESNVQERLEKNTIGNLARVSISEEPKAVMDDFQAKINGLKGTISSLKKRIDGAKRFGKNTSVLETQLEFNEKALEKLEKQTSKK